MGYLSCRADSSVITCRSLSATTTTTTTSSTSSSPNPKNHNHHRHNNKQDAGTVNPRPPQHENDDHKPTTNSSSPHPNILHFTYRELESATHNFSDQTLLGRGSHGAVYKASLRGGRLVAVKRPSRRTAQRNEVENEIDILSRIRSPCLVNLIGFTIHDPKSSKERLLVVEFMPNGTLYDFLHSNPRPPGWARRLRLALQTAKALLTLHSSRPPVIHRDIKSANILIDHNFNARLGDFGLALHDDAGLSSVRSTPPAGTLGYLDPCYVTPENLSTKTDVFSFGILLLEIVSGRKAIDVVHSPPSVVEWAVPLLRKGKVLALYDPRIAPPKDPAARRQLASLAASCVRSCKEKRPSMEEVVERLKVLSKTVPSRAWNALSVGYPCSVVETERTLSKLNPNNLNRNPNSRLIGRHSIGLEEPSNIIEEEMPMGMKKSPSSVKAVRPLRNATRVLSGAATGGSINLIDLMAGADGDPIKGFEDGIQMSGSQRATISRARTLRVARDYYDRNGILQLRRNQTVRGG